MLLKNLHPGTFHCFQCGECCGPVPVLDWELHEIVLALVKMPESVRERLQQQERGRLTCPLRDTMGGKCSVYESRPRICQLYGLTKGLVCPINPGAKLEDALPLLDATDRPGQKVSGILAIDLSWPELERLVQRETKGGKR